MKIKKFLIVAFSITVIVCSISGCGKNNKKDYEENTTTIDKHTGLDSYYVYPENPQLGIAYYKTLLRIPDETLEIMTSEQLAQAVIDYPLLGSDMVTSSSTDINKAAWGEKLSEECDAYRELLERKDGADALINKLEEIVNSTSQDKYIIYDALDLWEIAMEDKVLQQKMSLNQKERLEEIFTDMSK